jgi:hypothetical protein
VTVRAIGLVSADQPYQLDLFTDTARVEKRERLEQTVEVLREKYGPGIIRNAVLLHNPKMPGGDVLHRPV